MDEEIQVLFQYKYFDFPCRPQIGSADVVAPIQWTLGAVYAVVKQLGRNADHSAPSSGKVKNVSLHGRTSQRGVVLSNG
jgi:hypothetical protein